MGKKKVQGRQSSGQTHFHRKLHTLTLSLFFVWFVVKKKKLTFSCPANLLATTAPFVCVCGLSYLLLNSYSISSTHDFQ